MDNSLTLGHKLIIFLKMQSLMKIVMKNIVVSFVINHPENGDDSIITCSFCGVNMSHKVSKFSNTNFT